MRGWVEGSCVWRLLLVWISPIWTGRKRPKLAVKRKEAPQPELPLEVLNQLQSGAYPPLRPQSNLIMPKQLMAIVHKLSFM